MNIQQPTTPMNEVKGKRVTVSSPLLTRKQLADILQVSTQTITKSADRGQLKRRYIGGQERYPADLNGVEDYIILKEESNGID